MHFKIILKCRILLYNQIQRMIIIVQNDKNPVALYDAWCIAREWLYSGLDSHPVAVSYAWCMTESGYNLGLPCKASLTHKAAIGNKWSVLIRPGVCQQMEMVVGCTHSSHVSDTNSWFSWLILSHLINYIFLKIVMHLIENMKYFI